MESKKKCEEMKTENEAELQSPLFKMEIQCGNDYSELAVLIVIILVCVVLCILGIGIGIWCCKKLHDASKPTIIYVQPQTVQPDPNALQTGVPYKAPPTMPVAQGNPAYPPMQQLHMYPPQKNNMV